MPFSAFRSPPFALAIAVMLSVPLLAMFAVALPPSARASWPTPMPMCADARASPSLPVA